VKLLVKLANVYTSHYADEYNPRLCRCYNDRLRYMRWDTGGIDDQVLDSPKATWSISQDGKEIALDQKHTQVILVDIVLSTPPTGDVRVSV